MNEEATTIVKDMDGSPEPDIAPERFGFMQDPKGSLSSGRLAKMIFVGAAIVAAGLGIALRRDTVQYVAIFTAAALGHEITQKATGL